MNDKRTLDLARQWAVNVSPHPDDPCHAAAEIITSLPDEWVGADKLQEFIDEWEQLSLAEGADEVLDDLRRLLPAPTPPTLADMTPEERAECQWMQASLKGDDRRVVITEIKERVAYVLTGSGFPFGRGHDAVTPLPDLPRMVWPEESYPQDGGEEVPESAPIGTGGKLDEQKFDPAYTYRDKDGDEWRCRDGVWKHTARYNPNVWMGTYYTPPAWYGPYTRIEDTK